MKPSAKSHNLAAQCLDKDSDKGNTMILTDQECRDTYNAAMALPDRSIVSATRYIEAAVIRKLAAGVSVEPEFVNEVVYSGIAVNKTEHVSYYSLDQLTTAVAAARVQENERCATHAEGHYGDGHRLASEIRALIGETK